MPRGIHGHHVHADSLGETTRRRAFSDQPLRRCSRELLPTPLNFASSISPWTQDFDWEHERTIDQVWQGILSGKTDALEAGDHFRLASIIEVGITVGEVLCEMGWRFIYAPDGHRSLHPTIRW